MEGKNKEVRITIIVVAILFVIVVLASFWTSGFRVASLDANGDEASSVIDEEMVQEASEKGQVTLQDKPQGIGKPAGKLVLNSRLLAAEAYRAAANSGDAEAQFKMGEAYSNGQRVPSDPVATTWYRKSAAQGWPAAQYRLGMIYLEDASQTGNPIVAYALLRLAATHPVAPSVAAGVQLQELSRRMDAGQAREGEVLASALRESGNFLQVLDQALGK